MLAPGTLLGPYKILMAIGAGGMGEVYRAQDTRLQRDVAVKVLTRNLSTDSDALRRFVPGAFALTAVDMSASVAQGKRNGAMAP